MTLYITNLKEYTKNPLEIINEFSKVMDTGPTQNTKITCISIH